MARALRRVNQSAYRSNECAKPICASAAAIVIMVPIPLEYTGSQQEGEQVAEFADLRQRLEETFDLQRDGERFFAL